MTTPYRDDTEALRIQLEELEQRKAELESELARHGELEREHRRVLREVGHVRRALQGRATAEEEARTADAANARIGCLMCVGLGIGITTLGLVALVQWPNFTGSRIDSAHRGAQTVRTAAELFLADRPASACPSLYDLGREKKLERQKSLDPFGSPYRIDCSPDGEIEVHSNGRDRLPYTADDISADATPADLRRIREY